MIKYSSTIRLSLQDNWDHNHGQEIQNDWDHDHDQEITLGTLEEGIVCLAKDFFMCGLCPTSFTTKASVLRHMKSVHFKVRDHRCSFCDAAFGRKAHLVRHEKICKMKPE